MKIIESDKYKLLFRKKIPKFAKKKQWYSGKVINLYTKNAK